MTEDPERIGGEMLRLRSACLAGAEFFDWPVYSTDKLLAVIRIPAPDAIAMTGDQRQALHSVIRGRAAMDRYKRRARLRSEEEAARRYRGNPLRAISRPANSARRDHGHGGDPYRAGQRRRRGKITCPGDLQRRAVASRHRGERS
ncbi:MAG: hypothetical protein ACLUEQ_08505 [Cloacibacillus evryensis]